MKAIKSILLVGFIFTQFSQIKMAKADIDPEHLGFALQAGLIFATVFVASEGGEYFYKQELKQANRDKNGYTVQKGRTIDKSGYPVNDKNGDTALHEAAREGRFEIARVFVNNGIDIEARNDNGDTAVDVARHSDNFEIVELIENQRLLIAKKQIANKKKNSAAKKHGIKEIDDTEKKPSCRKVFNQ